MIKEIICSLDRCKAGSMMGFTHPCRKGCIHSMKKKKIMKKKIAVFTGAGISVESGVEAFRTGNKPLWGEFEIDDVATPRGWKKNPELVTKFYNDRRQELANVEPNEAHKLLAKLEEQYDVTVITQNIDDLHERGGSSNIHHLHGEIKMVRSVVNPNEKYDWGYNPVDLEKDRAKNNAKLRPDVVWFEEYPIEKSVQAGYESIISCDILLIIGTSLNIGYTLQMLSLVSNDAKIYYIDPNPCKSLFGDASNITYIQKGAVEGMSELAKELLQNGK